MKNATKKSFQTLKSCGVEAVVLASLEFNESFEDGCDGSGLALGVVLNQEVTTWHIADHNENFNETKKFKKYFTYMQFHKCCIMEALFHV